MENKEEKTKSLVLMLAGFFVILLSVGSPSRDRAAFAPDRKDRAVAKVIANNCIPDSLVKLPTLPGKLSFLCVLNEKTGKLEKYEKVSIPSPVVEEPGNVQAY